MLAVLNNHNLLLQTLTEVTTPTKASKRWVPARAVEVAATTEAAAGCAEASATSCADEEAAATDSQDSSPTGRPTSEVLDQVAPVDPTGEVATEGFAAEVVVLGS